MTAVVSPGDLVVFVGDSITAQGWMSVVGGLVDQINAQIPVVTRPRYATQGAGSVAATLAPGAVAATVAPVTTQAVIRPINSGETGDSVEHLATVVPARITDYDPDVVVMLIGINDINLSVGYELIVTSYDSVLSQIRAWSPTVQIACLSILYRGEQWAAGPVWQNSPSFDAPLDAVNAAIQSLCATYDATYIDVRSQALTYETVNNAPAPGAASGILSQDGIHPDATGQLQMGDWTIGSFTVTS